MEVAEHEDSLWIENIPEKPTTLVNRLNTKHLIEGRYLNIYKKTREFAATPIINSGKFLGLLLVEMELPQILERGDIKWMNDLARSTGKLIAKADNFERMDAEANNVIERFSSQAANRNAKLIRSAARHARLVEEHHTALERFYEIAPYDKSVFIMTKYPEGTVTDDDRKLNRVIETVKREVLAYGFTPRLANEKNFDAMLWKNVEIYLLGCSRGIAIVENRYSNELNPNVAMEWGWMRASGNDVLYLLENKCRPHRADFEGFLWEEFDWDFPEDGIKAAIAKWLR